MIVSIATAIIWIFYLQVFLMSYLRQTRASLLITMAGGKTSRARCIVSNMSSEPAFLVEVIAELEQNGTNLSMSVTDRIGFQPSADPEDTGSADASSAHGPVQSGGHVDVGSFQDIFSRAERQLNHKAEDFDHFRIIAVAATNQARGLIAAHRSFEIQNGRVTPVEVEASQVRSRRTRQKIKRVLERLQKEDWIEGLVSDEISIGRK
ncbi:hypothetical protein [Salipiger sp. PrR003]|uniref:hypothetical protein n=1 Tax=Salipiger sp. PrR003 TaxID=2706776 RepID=UPI0013DD3122|nr:hypothetical protein [Salipiger sp. PrR003]NDV50094.1 hypothetical protein [Salipiger sp. PrR003]